jgi:2-methylcitrate dehydratase PrpD
VLDACLALRAEHAIEPDAIERIRIAAASVAVKLTGKRARDGYQARTSLYYWAATALLRGRVGIDALDASSFSDPAMARLQDRMELAADPALQADGARVSIVLADGRTVDMTVDHCIGSTTRPMTDAGLERKFRALCDPVLGAPRAGALLAACWTIEGAADAAPLVRATALA